MTDNRMQILPEVQITELSAKIAYFDTRVLLLSQTLYNVDAEAKELSEKLVAAASNEDDLKAKLEQLHGLLQVAENNVDELQRKLWLAENKAASTPATIAAAALDAVGIEPVPVVAAPVVEVAPLAPAPVFTGDATFSTPSLQKVF